MTVEGRLVWKQTRETRRPRGTREKDRRDTVVSERAAEGTGLSESQVPFRARRMRGPLRPRQDAEDIEDFAEMNLEFRKLQ